MLNHCIQAAGEWLLGSGIQYPNGGVARYYRTDRHQNAPISTEITGYTASMLFELHAYFSDRRYLDAASKATTFLVNRAWNKDSNAMPFEFGNGCDYSYFFDIGIVTRALLTGFRKTQDNRLKDAARACADSMANDFVQESGFSPVIELPSKNKLRYNESRWSRAPGCYQLKAALAWYELWEFTKDSRYLTLHGDIVESALSSHEEFLLRGETEADVMDRLHAYCYFLEGLLPALAWRPQCAEVMRSGIRRVADSTARIGPQFLRSDVLAQLLRLRLMADEIGILKLDPQAASRELSVLEGFQCHDESMRVRGAFWFGRKKGEFLPFSNPVSTIFAIQALQMWDERQELTNAGRGNLI